MAGLTVSGQFKELEARRLACRACSLRTRCRQVVFGEGNPSAVVMFVGEAPGAEEDRLGRPFVGPAGRLLDRLLAYAGFARARGVHNHRRQVPPAGEQAARAWGSGGLPPIPARADPLIRPRIIVCLGALATQAMLDPQTRITRVRGQWFEGNSVKISCRRSTRRRSCAREKLRPAAEDFRKLAAARRAFEEARLRERGPARAEQLSLDFSGGGRGLA